MYDQIADFFAEERHRSKDEQQSAIVDGLERAVHEGLGELSSGPDGDRNDRFKGKVAAYLQKHAESLGDRDLSKSRELLARLVFAMNRKHIWDMTAPAYPVPFTEVARLCSPRLAEVMGLLQHMQQNWEAALIVSRTRPDALSSQQWTGLWVFSLLTNDLVGDLEVLTRLLRDPFGSFEAEDSLLRIVLWQSDDAQRRAPEFVRPVHHLTESFVRRFWRLHKTGAVQASLETPSTRPQFKKLLIGLFAKDHAIPSRLKWSELVQAAELSALDDGVWPTFLDYANNRSVSRPLEPGSDLAARHDARPEAPLPATPPRRKVADVPAPCSSRDALKQTKNALKTLPRSGYQSAVKVLFQSLLDRIVPEASGTLIEMIVSWVLDKSSEKKTFKTQTLIQEIDLLLGLEACLPGRGIDSLTGDDWIEAVENLLDARCEGARPKYSSHLHSFFEWAFTKGWIEPFDVSAADGFGYRNSPGRAVTVVPREYARLKKHMAEAAPNTSVRLRTIRFLCLVLAYRLSLRRWEIRSLKIGDIQFSDEPEVRVRWACKSPSAERPVPLDWMTDEELDQLRAWHQQRMDESGGVWRQPLFTADADATEAISPFLSTDWVTKQMKVVLRDPMATIHWCRHALPNAMVLAMAEVGGFDVITDLAGYDSPEFDRNHRERIVFRLMGHRRLGLARAWDFLYGLAVRMGHATPSNTLRMYIHTLPYVLAAMLRTRNRFVTPKLANALASPPNGQVRRLLGDRDLEQGYPLEAVVRACRRWKLPAGVVYRQSSSISRP